ncbi:glycosyltransferase family 4 protein [Pseudogulbenkiania ferrooxidans]|uniref:Glycosyl transferase group 1 n=1 Tax=Pseudogulbenkiania ferrooxidans 2002 TaxID=279714 RepID=B9YYP5_9NEIS|nr:glycosyltransferase family 4 protein [Pseudogulbenkiania ferrooxidans]EEG10248.1 glycosyl transferase group 1 [Pseudogulbenkiania ferrooxidans 2002]
MKILQIQFWGDACELTGSVEKVIDGFARMQFPNVELVIASLGVRENDTVRHGKRYIHFQESYWQNKILNKILRLGAFTFHDLIRIIEVEKPDIVHFHNRPEQVDALISKLSYRPVVVIHYHRRFKKFTFASCADRLLAVSHAVRDSLISAGADPAVVDVVYNPIPCSIVKGSRQHENDEVVFLYAGGGHRHKGFMEIMEVVGNDCFQGRAKFLICGPELPIDLPAYPWVEYLGLLKVDRFQEILATADVVLMPSEHEGFGLVALEALASGKLLISTRGGGLAELVDPSVALIHEFGDTKSMYGKITEAIDMLTGTNKTHYQYLMKNAEAKIATFSVEAVNTSLVHFYSSLM